MPQEEDYQNDFKWCNTKICSTINPIIFGYERLCVLIVRNTDKTIKERDLLKKVSLLGNVTAYSEELEGSYIFGLYAKDIEQDKIEIVTDDIC